MATSVVATSGSLAAAGSEDTSRGCARRDTAAGAGRTTELPIRSRTRWLSPDTTQQCPLAARLPNGTAYRCRTFATMYRRNVGVKWGVDLESMATRLLRSIDQRISAV